MWQNMGREIQLDHRKMAFSWISVGGNGGRRRNCGREIQLKRREMAFPWISVGGNYGMRRNHGREIHGVSVDFCRRK